jgi:two-component system, OmpR family, sensor histidine kinase CiaH
MPFHIKKIRKAFIIYWVLLAYIVAALIWWFIALTRQNEQMSLYKMQDIKKDDIQYQQKLIQVNTEKKRKTAQYLGEGGTFLLLIIAGAIFVFRIVRRELKISADQQNFMMAITHELKTPIAVAKLNLETLQKRKLDETMQQRLLHNTLQETNRLNTLCNNMLLSSQIEAGGYKIGDEEINFSTLVAGCADDFINRFPEREIVKNIDPEIFVNGDNFLFQIAVNNLLDNAIKYSPKEKSIKITLQNENHQAVLKIADQGGGIIPADREKVFEKFYRTGNEATKRAKGTGLGLYLTKRITLTHKGIISMEENIGGGSIFVLKLKANGETELV